MYYVYTAISLLFLAFKTSPFVLGGDNGEFLVNGILGGLIHPPGYPLYGIWVRILGLFPFDPIYMGNFSSAFFTSGTLFILLKIANSKCWIMNALISLLFCFNPLVLQYSTETEVFTLNIFLVSLLYYALSNKRFFLGFFLAGLSLTNHFTVLFILIPFAGLFVKDLLSEKWKLTDYIKALGLFFLGLLPYAYLFLTNEVITSFGQITNLQTFMDHVGRKIYSNASLASGEVKGSSLIEVYGVMLKELVIRWAAIPLLLVAYIRRNDYKNDFPLLGGIVFYGLGFFALANINFNNPVNYDLLRSYYLLLDILIILIFVRGVKNIERKHLRNITLAAILLFSFVNIRFIVEKRNPAFHLWARKTLESLPKNSILFLNGDHGFGSFLAVQKLSNIREDVKLIPFDFLNKPWSTEWFKTHFPKLSLPPGKYYTPRGYNLNSFISANPGFSYFIQGSIPLRKWDNSINNNYDVVTWGTVSRIVPKNYLTNSFKEWSQQNIKLFEAIESTPNEFRNDTWYFAYYYEMAHHYNKYALNVLMNAKKLGHGLSFHEKAVKYMTKASQGNILRNPALFKNIGMAYMELGNREKSKEFFKKYLNYVDNDPGITSLLKQL